LICTKVGILAINYPYFEVFFLIFFFINKK
jgi:hypothetical protein